MYKDQNHQRLNEISHFPRLEDLKLILSEAVKCRGCTIELPWRSAKTGKFYAITGLVEITSKDIVWTLYLGEGAASTAVWSTAFNDLEMLVDVMVLSLPDETESTNMPREVAPRFRSVPGAPPMPGMSPPMPGPTPPMPGAYPPPQVYPPAQPYPPAPGQPAAHVSGAYPTAPGYPPPYPPGFLPPPVNYPLPPGYAVPPGYVPPPGHPPYPAAPVHPGGYAPLPNPMPPYPPQPVAPPIPPAVPLANASATQQSSRSASELQSSNTPLQPNAEMLKKRSNVKLGQFLVQADLIPGRTLEAALFLQDLVKGNVLTIPQAAEALARAHNRGGTLESNIFLAKPKPIEGPRITLPLGQIMVEAGLISQDALEAALKLQDAARTGVLTAEEALDTFVTETYKKSSTTGSQKPRPEQDAQQEMTTRLLLRTGRITRQDIEAAQKVETKHGGSILNILFAAAKIEQSIIDAATELTALVEKNKLKEDQAVMALDYCQRSRVSLKEALAELHWSV